MKELIDELVARGIQLPILLRFSRHPARAHRAPVRVRSTARSASTATRVEYRGVYPIKVNQNRYVVEEIIDYGSPFHYGLEAGCKPELLAIMAMLDTDEALIICNGYKDEEYIETALLASKMGKTVILVVEKPSELDSDPSGVASASASSRSSASARAVVARRRAAGSTRAATSRSSACRRARWSRRSRSSRSGAMLDTLQAPALPPRLADLGDQIVKNALREAGRFFVELLQAGRAGLKYLDVGGGLGVDYDGSQTNFASSMNYTVQEYANDVVYAIEEICDADQVPHPTIVSESGRAIAAHHSVLVVNVLGVTEFNERNVPEQLPEPVPPLVRNMWETYRSVSRKNLLESYHDAVEYKDEVAPAVQPRAPVARAPRAVREPVLGDLREDPAHRARARRTCPRSSRASRRRSPTPTSATSRCSSRCPTAWAIDQLFPICPIHRLNEEPTRRATLADITCDSDGKID